MKLRVLLVAAIMVGMSVTDHAEAQDITSPKWVYTALSGASLDREVSLDRPIFRLRTLTAGSDEIP